MTQNVYNDYISHGFTLNELSSTGKKPKRSRKIDGICKDTTKPYNPKMWYYSVPPSNIVVIDVDVKDDKVGLESYSKFLNDLGLEEWEVTPAVRTGSGGFHVYAYCDLALDSTQEKYPDIDFQTKNIDPDKCPRYGVAGGQTVRYDNKDYTYTMLEYSLVINTLDGLGDILTQQQLHKAESTNDEMFYDLDNPDDKNGVKVGKRSLDELRSVLNYIDPDMDYDTWMKTCSAIQREVGKNDEGFKLFNEWAKGWSEYNEQDCIDKWENVGTPANGWSVGSLILNARKSKLATYVKKVEDATKDKELLGLFDDEDWAAFPTVKDEDIEPLAQAVKKQHKVLTGATMNINTARKTVRVTSKQSAGGIKFPDMYHSKTTVKVLNTLKNLLYFVENHSTVDFKYDVVLKRPIVNGEYDVKIGTQTLGRSQLFDELTRAGVNADTMLRQHYEAMLFTKSDNALLRYVKGLAEWDGETDYIKKVADTLTTRIATDEYCYEVVKSFVIQAIAAWDNRENTPQTLSRLDSVMVFAGEQGGGKTTWVGRLMPNFMGWYFKDGVELDPSNKDSYIQATQAGLVELGELDATNRKADISSLKAFLSNLTDEYRAPYGRSAERYPRQTVFVGTVNNPDFLKDATGSRRFLTLDVTSLELPDKDVIEGLWSQALALYLSGVDWRLPEKFISLRDKVNEAHTDHGEAGDFAKDFIEAVKQCTGRKKKMSITKVTTELGMKLDKRARGDFIATLSMHGIKRYEDGKFYLPEDCFLHFNALKNADQFQDLTKEEEEEL
ncbi:MAG: hypothetical protein DRJ64_08600 [Thermoprotei archaeon]|nr:MAG: hypothetical protein DRJ64_08600 [Thermoprotei archaeon]